MFRKLLLTITILVVLVAILAGMLLWTIRPKEKLDLSFERISIAAIIKDMVARRSLEIRLTEQDLNNLLKRELSKRTQPVPHILIEGAKFEQHGQLVTAHVQALAYNHIQAAVTLDFQLKWQPPNLVVEHLQTKAGPWKVPFNRFRLDPILVPLDEELPPLVAIRDVMFEKSQVLISFRMR